MLHTVNVNRPANSQNAEGGISTTYNSAYTSLACAIQPVSSSWKLYYASKHIEVTNTFYFIDNPSLLNGDQIVYGSRLYLVEGIRSLSETGRMVLADAREIV